MRWGREDLAAQVLSRHGDRTSINPLPFETHEQWKHLLPTERQVAALDSRAVPVPPDARLIDTTRPSWHGQLTTSGVNQLADTVRRCKLNVNEPVILKGRTVSNG